MIRGIYKTNKKYALSKMLILLNVLVTITVCTVYFVLVHVHYVTVFHTTQLE